MKRAATTLAMVGAIAATGPVFAASTFAATPAKPAESSSYCSTAVKIHTQPHYKNTAVGVCEKGDGVAINSENDFGDYTTCAYGSSSPIWFDITDYRTGVTGWVPACYVP